VDSEDDATQATLFRVRGVQQSAWRPGRGVLETPWRQARCFASGKVRGVQGVADATLHGGRHGGRHARWRTPRCFPDVTLWTPRALADSTRLAGRHALDATRVGGRHALDATLFPQTPRQLADATPWTPTHFPGRHGAFRTPLPGRHALSRTPRCVAPGQAPRLPGKQRGVRTGTGIVSNAWMRPGTHITSAKTYHERQTKASLPDATSPMQDTRMGYRNGTCTSHADSARRSSQDAEAHAHHARSERAHAHGHPAVPSPRPSPGAPPLRTTSRISLLRTMSAGPTAMKKDTRATVYSMLLPGDPGDIALRSHPAPGCRQVHDEPPAFVLCLHNQRRAGPRRGGEHRPESAEAQRTRTPPYSMPHASPPRRHPPAVRGRSRAELGEGRV